MTTRKTQESFDDHMNAMFSRMMQAADGQPSIDVAIVCCALIAACMQSMPAKRRGEAQTQVYKFLAELIGTYQ